ncbi:MAG: GGDEF domain-containing protein [Solirubrobacterales bacterium]
MAEKGDMQDSAFTDDEREPIGGNPTPAGADPSQLMLGDDDGYDGLSSRIAWRSAAVLFVVAGVGAIFEISTGLLDGQLERPNIVIAVSVFAIFMGAVWWVVGELDVDDRWLHLGVLMSYAILVTVFGNAPAVEAQLGIVYLVPLIFVALFLPSRSLVFYIFLSVGLIVSAMLRNSGGEFGALPGVMAIAALALTASLTLYVRLELDRIGRQAAQLSGRDALTGLANLRPLYERVERGVHDAERGIGGISVIMLDLEGFKRVNDQYSHSVGDETLRVVARAISETVRRDELVARRGGDEFAIVTGATDPDVIEALMRRVADNVSDARVDILPQVRSGVTVGYATFREGDTVGQLLARADRELHEAKTRAKLERWSWRTRQLDDIADELGSGA